MAEIDLAFVARKLDRVLTEQAAFRDELRVQAAMIQRPDGNVRALDTTLSAILAQIIRKSDRIRKALRFGALIRFDLFDLRTAFGQTLLLPLHLLVKMCSCRRGTASRIFESGVEQRSQAFSPLLCTTMISSPSSSPISSSRHRRRAVWFHAVPCASGREPGPSRQIS
jgi:hypothetical protein